MLYVVHKEVGGCLISYNLQLACVMCMEVGGYLTRCALPRRSLKLIIINHSLTHESIELLGQLKMIHFLILSLEGVCNPMYTYILPIKRLFIDVNVLHTIDIVNYLRNVKYFLVIHQQGRIPPAITALHLTL